MLEGLDGEMRVKTRQFLRLLLWAAEALEAVTRMGRREGLVQVVEAEMAILSRAEMVFSRVQSREGLAMTEALAEITSVAAVAEQEKRERTEVTEEKAATEKRAVLLVFLFFTQEGALEAEPDPLRVKGEPAAVAEHKKRV